MACNDRITFACWATSIARSASHRRLRHMSEKASFILLVEDNDADAELTIGVLRKMSPLAVITRVRDGSEALDFVLREGDFQQRKRGLPDLVLLDLQMARVGGIDVLQTLKSDELTRSIPVIILTGSTDARVQAVSSKLGAAGYLIKPIRPESLALIWPK
jgi:two-component system, response regulator